MKGRKSMTMNERKREFDNEWKEGRENMTMNEREREYNNEWTEERIWQWMKGRENIRMNERKGEYNNEWKEERIWKWMNTIVFPKCGLIRPADLVTIYKDWENIEICPFSSPRWALNPWNTF